MTRQLTSLQWHHEKTSGTDSNGQDIMTSQKDIGELHQLKRRNDSNWNDIISWLSGSDANTDIKDIDGRNDITDTDGMTSRVWQTLIEIQEGWTRHLEGHHGSDIMTFETLTGQLTAKDRQYRDDIVLRQLRWDSNRISPQGWTGVFSGFHKPVFPSHILYPCKDGQIRQK